MRKQDMWVPSAGRSRRFVTAAFPMAASASAGAADAGGASSWPGLLPAALVAAAVLVLAIAAVALVWRAFVDGEGEGFSFRWNAGGFGGVGTGWRLSGPLVRISAGLALGVFAVMLAMTPGLFDVSRAKVPQAAEGPARSATDEKPAAAKRDAGQQGVTVPAPSLASAASR